ncbi:DUF2442 domain-containing protein [Phenylobacterium sp.]|jgi:hypothetical protein|uniref:DUF2442 domain-containing protein n=1 Tax=Phenylobacterium sp. TaxID=1871053 RepID=UPI002F9392AC
MANEVKAADAAAKERLDQTPRAVGASYAAAQDRLLVELSSGLGLLLDYRRVEGLERAAPSDLDAVVISPSGYGLHFPTLDADVYLPALLEGQLGSRRFMASRLGRAGGKARTAAKSGAARANGRLGGRPRKDKSAQR